MNTVFLKMLAELSTLVESLGSTTDDVQSGWRALGFHSMKVHDNSHIVCPPCHYQASKERD